MTSYNYNSTEPPKARPIPETPAPPAISVGLDTRGASESSRSPSLLLPGELSLAEVVQLGAVDTNFFNRFWFPKTFRQEPAPFHKEIYDLVEDVRNRYINIEVTRDGAKTTLLRALCGKRIAYGITRTAVYVGKSEKHAKRSVRWIRNQIERNSNFTAAFGLSKGKAWTDEECEIRHGPMGHSIWLVALGITGSTRGVNIDDYRPDLIVVDDVMDDQNAATKDGREKIIVAVLGALKESLSPATETPHAKMLLLNTPQDFEDLSQEAKKDLQFKSARFGCWTKATEGLPVDMQESSWPARYPSETLRLEKKSAIARNRYSIFAKEKECLLVTPEHCAFKAEWLRYYGPGEAHELPPLHEMVIEIAIDPVPPPSQLDLAKGDLKKDFESFAVVGRHHGSYYLLDQISNRGHTPTWTIQTFFELGLKYRPRKFLVEAVAYQRTLEWLLREAMRRAGRYYMVVPFDDKRAKYERIVQGIQGIASNGQLFVPKSATNFVSQYIHYPGKNPDGDYDDDIESAAVALTSLSTGFAPGMGTLTAGAIDDTEFEDLGDYRGAP